jgi:Tfp pilus assembly protein PilF
MKKVLIIALVSFIAFGAQAQKLNIQNALSALKENDVAKAKEYIDKATTNESTKKDGKAWLIRAFIYQAIGTNAGDLKNPKTGQAIPFVANINGKPIQIDLGKANSLQPTTDKPLKKSLQSFNRYIVYSRKPDNDIAARAASMILLSGYGQGVKAYQAEQYDKAFEKFALVDRISNLKKGKFIPALPSQYDPFKKQIKDVKANILKLKASALYKKGDDNATLPVLLEAMKSPGSSSPEVYLMAADIYQKQNNTAKYESILKEGIAKYADNKALKNEELNYLLRTNKVDQAVSKFEDAIKKEPTNPEYHLNAGALYAKLSGAAKDAPTKASYFTKAESAYQKAISLDGSKPDYQFNLGALYYNKAKDLGDVMKNETDNTKYKALKKQYDGILGQALPILEKTRATLEASDLTKNAKNLSTYKSTLGALKSAYVNLNKLDKATEITQLLKKYK